MSANLTILSSGAIQYNAFQIRGAAVAMNCFHPNAHNYQPNAWDIIEDLGINVIRAWGGVEGNVWRINIKNHPSEWAQNLDTFLSEADSHSVKVIFYEMGCSWGTLFGIVAPPQGVGPYAPVSVSEAKSMIDQLAGNNALGHNFITDPRVLLWGVANRETLLTVTL